MEDNRTSRPARTQRGTRAPGAYFGVPMPVWVIVLLILGVAVGFLFRGTHAANAIYVSGTYFPKAVVTFATLIIFFILSGATAKLVLLHRARAGRLFGLILAAYVALGLASLIYVTIWIPFLTGLSLTAPGAETPTLDQWARELARSVFTLFSDQPLIQALISAVVLGYATAVTPRFQPIANALMTFGEFVLSLFRQFLWYYPLMIGCLAIGIPLKFGAKGMATYGQTTLWVAIVTVSWSMLLVVFVKLTTVRSWRQIASYYASVWPTGFGTGGSYETLAMNVVAAESDLGLTCDIAEVSVVFGTVMNKSCATMCVFLVTISVARLLEFPISLVEILTLIPPVLILGLESPGIPGGAAFFMSPVVAVLLRVPDVDVFVATFISMYSGLIPMFSTAGNTTNDGLVGAILQDRFAGRTGHSDLNVRAPAAAITPVKISPLGWIALAAGAWMIVSPQAVLGLDQLKWMHDYAFPGEVVVGAVVTCAALYFLTRTLSKDAADDRAQHNRFRH